MFNRRRNAFGISNWKIHQLILIFLLLLFVVNNYEVFIPSSSLSEGQPRMGFVEGAYRFLGELTNTTKTNVSTVYVDAQSGQSTTNYTVTTSTSTIGYGSFSYTYESDEISWQIIMDTELPSFSNASSSISLRYYRLVHKNILLTDLSKNLFISVENITTILKSQNLLNGSNGLDISPDGMLIRLNGTTKGKFSNSSKLFDVPELFASAYTFQLFSIQLNTSKLQDNSTYPAVVDPTKILVNYTQLKGKNPTYTYKVLESVKEYIKVISVTSTSLKNLCSSSSPIIAFTWGSWKLWFVLSIVILMLLMLVASWWRPYFIVFMTLVILNLSGIINLTQTLSGFSNDGMLTVLLLFPIVQPLSENSFVLRGSKLIFGTAKYGLWLCMLRLCLVISVISPFINNTPIVVTALPIIKDWARENNIAASKFLMAMCYITTAAGLMTLIGTSTNIVTNGLYTAYGYEPFTFYEFFYIGSILTFITIIYLCTYGLWVSPNRKGGMFRLARERGEQFLTKLTVDKKNSALIGKNKAKVITYLGLDKLEVVEIIRKKTTQVPATPSQDKFNGTTYSPTKVVTTIMSNSDEDLEHIVPVPDDLTIQLYDTIIFKSNPNNILKLHSMVGLSETLEQDQKEETNILHTMLGTENLQIDTNTNTKDVTLTEKKSPLSPRKTVEENDQEVVVEISDSEAASTNDLIIGENAHSTEDQFSSAPPIPKTSLKNKIKEQNLHELVLKKTLEEEERRRSSTDEAQEMEEVPSVETPTESEQKMEVDTIDNTENKTVDTSTESKKKEETDSENEPEFFEVVISTFNPCMGDMYSEFEKRYGVVILAVRHNKGLETKTDVTDFKTTKVKTGDTLLLIGKADFYSKWHETKDFYVISRCNVSPKEKSKHQKFIVNIPFTKKSVNLWWWEHLIFPFFITMIAVAIAGYSMLQCAMVALCVIIIFRLITPIKAIESIEWPLIALIGSSFGIGTAITQSGMGEALAELLRLMNVPIILLPAFVVFITLIVTAVITNNAAVAVCFPLAMAIARSYGLNPRCFAMCVCIAASSVFATPIGYQCNMMIMGPGGYSFVDYVKIGLPLTIIYFFAISTFVPLIWGLEVPNF